MKFFLSTIIILVIIFVTVITSPLNEHSLVLNKELPKKIKEFKILFVGDMFFDRTIRQKIDTKGWDYIFSCIDDELFSKADLVVGNLEGPITNNPSISLGSEIGSPENFIFTFPIRTAELLAKYNIKLVNIGNNHIGNFGKEGIATTKEYLKLAGVNFFGGLVGDESIYRMKHEDKTISFVSYNEFGGDSTEVVSNKIREEKSIGNLVILYTHWGQEYAEDVMHLKERTQVFSESGADFIFGSHPHVVLPSEKVNNTIVYYSLGNFIFDQYWEERVSTGLAVLLTIKGDKYVVEEFPVSINRDGTTCLK